MKALFLLLSALLLSAPVPAFARKGDISPVKGKGVDVRPNKAGRLLASAEVKGVRVELSVTTGDGLLSLHVQVRNRTGEPVKLEPNCVTVVSDGDVVDPLDPEAYIELAYPDVRLLPVDKKGNILEDKSKPPIKVFTPGAQVPGTSSGASIAEQMTAETWEGGATEQRMVVTKELVRMKKSVVPFGGMLQTDSVENAKLVYQRNTIVIPFDAKFQHEGATLTVRFQREK